MHDVTCIMYYVNFALEVRVYYSDNIISSSETQQKESTIMHTLNKYKHTPTKLQQCLTVISGANLYYSSYVQGTRR